MKKTWMLIAASLLFFAGAAIFWYPFAMNWNYSRKSDHQIKEYERKMWDLQQTKKVEGNVENPLDLLFQKMTAYNEQIYKERQQGLRDPFAYEKSEVDLGEYGFTDKMFGYITIPAMDVKLPVYLGATQDHLKKGAALLGQTSMPTGGENTNIVLAAHRGYHGIPMFREIEKMTVGDCLTLTTPWGVMSYEVEECKVIDPDAVEDILIRPGRELLTLLTCHPYRNNTHRYIVVCGRVDTP